MLNDCSSIPHVYFMNLFSNGEYLRISEAQFKHARSAVCLHLQIQMIVCSALFEMFVLFKDTNFWICFNSVTWRSNWTVLVSGFALCICLTWSLCSTSASDLWQVTRALVSGTAHLRAHTLIVKSLFSPSNKTTYNSIWVIHKGRTQKIPVSDLPPPLADVRI